MMAAFGSISTNTLAVLGLVCAALVTLLTTADACRCAGVELCDALTNEKTIVFRGTALERLEIDSTSSQVIYSLELVTLYAGSLEHKTTSGDPVIIHVYTPASSAGCGLTLGIGDDYILQVYYDPETDRITGGSCSFNKAWDAISKAEYYNLQDGCDVDDDNDETTDDPCDGTCTKYQECIPYTKPTAGLEKYYCKDISSSDYSSSPSP